ncbi:MAG: thioredoxin fold domain-containing protein [Candidatus Omnitrophica bacterium]|nr:thioredoxin fold domain-containing protein [Candidatus Omnitrophota bacterium]
MMELPGGPLSFLGIFFSGLALNLTPCVYPMLSVTAALFGKHQHTSKTVAFGHALVYVLGIAVTYTSLGVGAALTGSLFGGLLQNRWVLVAIAGIIGILAMSLFGVYTFQLPSWMIQKAGEESHRKGLLGIFLSGLFVGVFAAPCIGPPILALLTFVGTRQDPTFAFLVFFILSLGLGMPYLVLGTFSGLLHRLPKSGMWLVWMEKLYGVILLALSLFYLFLAFNPDLIKWLGPAALMAGGIYLGFMERSSIYSEKFVMGKKLLGFLAVLGGLLGFILMPREGVIWEPYSPEKLENAKSASQKVVMDFFADWCIPCHELDQYTYTDRRVITALEDFMRLKVDLTEADTKEIQDVIDKFDIIGVPTLLFLDEKGEEKKAARITGFVSAQEFLDILKTLKPVNETKGG